ncbi:MAG: LuxR C-terminal-related transcriptional regulator [Erythrobacter sp.]|uniref:helix-turn-helix transcriptional regulator n=1 Tax=Erythrobacter sp. TaxID=1042 RepID=UPI0026230FD4|nr:LuxR C-terminal-related transcriptional regulator [Erythrobacter sp.]MDJ0977662.1 LuxR C-terminal-related transcriptional regulator [Erythrobacter sp.]
MQRHFETIEGLSDIGEILLYSSQLCRDQGVIRQSYHLTQPFDAQNSAHALVYADGFREEWLARYEDEEFRKSDPIPERTMQRGAILSWMDARSAAPNTAANEAYFAAMDKEGLRYGFGLPLFGPRGRNAYASFDFGKPICEIAPKTLGFVRAVPQAAHQRICVLLDAMDATPELSERERQVLQWVVRGKSFAAIAQILGIAPDTVKTYARRIYAKLDVSDRVGATVAALKLGLVTV